MRAISRSTTIAAGSSATRTEIRLTPKEFDLLSLLARNHDRVLTHRAILKAVWGPNAVEQPEHLWTLVAQLRKKIEPDPANPKYLLSEPWVGYRFVTEDRGSAAAQALQACRTFSDSSARRGELVLRERLLRRP